MLFSKLRRASFFQKQLMAIIGTNLLILAIAAFLIYSAFVDDYRDNLVKTMDSNASLLSAASRSALLFHDEHAGQTILASLAKIPAMRFAQLLDSEKKRFATYTRDDASWDVMLDDIKPGHFFTNDNLYLTQDITLGEDVLGYIVLSADTHSLQAQQRRYGRIVLWVFALGSLLAYLLNWRMQKRLQSPVKRLIHLVDYVAKEGRYDQRIFNRRQDDIGRLVNGINSMLDTIEEHQSKLSEHHEHLEGLVELRTEQLYERANFDALTQLPNRHSLTEKISQAIEIARERKTNLALMFLDLDRFKVINDSLGHFMGDKLLIEVAKKIQHKLSDSDVVGRWGGDEFVVLIQNPKELSSVDSLAKEIIASLSLPLIVSGHQLHISTSIGIACFPDDGDDASSLLKHADTSMYKAKELGPGRFRFFDQDMLNDSVWRLELETQLRQASAQQQFALVYQPKVNVNDEQLVGLEALIRWNNGQEYINPATFLPIAEDIGLMESISVWVLKQACQQNADWQRAGFDIVPVAVNLPASFLMSPQCLELIKGALHQSGLAAQYLEIEITENTFIASTELAVDVLSAIHGLGVKIAIDDFGTGYSCMSYLRDLPINTLKIDGIFINDLVAPDCVHEGNAEDHHLRDEGIVRTIITLGKSLGLSTVAECVEHDYQVQILKSMGCDIIQGYFYSKPLKVVALEAYLGAHGRAAKES
ncbi:diguanylate cyclase/phosphodiesterase [Paraglaciecola sp. T6c]|uniref:putative bifunctional diguanylate cyclase/phosphodiesterase n=1 Tax=Pseudoalteromonas atlantica (strain T6c / ATCC BAA-1087) TaxID=3042615 RepID=UPI00005C6560|nr:EAL domain-containing protein [Paraglaciecola sp. T6c]ABG39809.1 diguanylate cyclase/phosphodiesterase [Paraglaciecola sp. T6c]